MISKGLLYLLLLQAGFTLEQTPTMICIAEKESGLKPRAINKHLNTDGTADYGLYQINDYFWFKPCKLNVYKALIPLYNVQCAKKVYDTLGYTAWVAYKKHKKECDNRIFKRYSILEKE